MANENENSGKWDQTKGNLREAWGDATDNPEQKRKGQVEQGGGKVKEAVGKVEEKAKDWLDKDKDKNR